MKPRILVLGNENYINAIEYCGGEAIYSYSPSDSLDFDGLNGGFFRLSAVGPSR